MTNKLTDHGTTRIQTIDLTAWVMCGWSWVRSDGAGYEIIARIIPLGKTT